MCIILPVLHTDALGTEQLNQVSKFHILLEFPLLISFKQYLQVWQLVLNFVVQNLLQFVIQHSGQSQLVCLNMRVCE